MIRIRRSAHRAFSLVELLVGLAIIGMLATLLLPAVQQSREAARKSTCVNNLRQMGLAINMFEQSWKHLPSAAYGRPYGMIDDLIDRPIDDAIASPMTDLLPYLDQQPTASKYRWDKDWFDPLNQDAVRVRVPVYLCPSSPARSLKRGIGSAGIRKPDLFGGVTDYSAVYSWGYPFAMPGPNANTDIWGVSALSPMIETGGFARPTLVQTTDGASNTLTFVEQADQANRWILNRLTGENIYNGQAWAPWAGEAATWILSYVADGSTWAPSGLGPCNVNCNNGQGVYAFHTDGANVLFLDSSVRYLSKNIDPVVLYSLVTRSRNDIQYLDANFK